MVDNNENILVEFDYNNITIVDPNKVIDSDGKVKERYVKQENLVFYANLECDVLPRTKLAVGVANNDSIRTVAVASINFLRQGNKEFLENSYTDEITGNDSLKGLGDNQVKQEKIENNPKDSFIRQNILTGGKSGAKDNGLLGITSISVKQGLDFLPVINITLEDIKGRALFESGDNSPYAAFFNLPYPQFKLTLKGYYGKAIKLSLMLQSFNSRYDTYSGNFKIDLKFYTYKYTILNEISMGYLLAVPHMYQSRIQIQPIQGSKNTKFNSVKETTVSRGFQKVKELYSEYKSKGLIPDDFPEITLNQMREKLENFLTNELDKFTKVYEQPLIDVSDYSDLLDKYKFAVYDEYNTNTSNSLSWYNKFMDTQNSIITKDGIEVFTFKSNFDSQQREDAKSDLRGIINNYNNQLNKNKTLGENGGYTINNKTEKISNKSSITYETFILEPNLTIEDIDIKATYLKNKKTKDEPTGETLNKYYIELSKNLGLSTSFTFKDGTIEKSSDWFYFKSPNTLQVQGNVNSLPLIGNKSFLDKIDKMKKDLKVFTEKIESELTEALSNLVISNNSGIGFVPNMRNVLAVIFANGEAFLRLMDDVHSAAWNINDNKNLLEIRKKAILNPQVASASQDNKNSGVDNDTPIYPWPQMIKKTDGTDGHELYEIVYPGDYSVVDQTKAYLPEYWPEVEFVEEFISGFSQRENPLPSIVSTQNEQTEPQRITLNAMEFPISNNVYANKEEVKFFYEIYERILFVSYYSRLIRSNSFIPDSDKVSNIISEAESENILKSLSNDNPFLIKKLKEYDYKSKDFEEYLRHISNEGVGESWQNFIRGIFNTTYIKNKINNSSFEFITQEVITNSLAQPLVSLPTEPQFNDYISNSTTSNEYDFADIYPFTNTNWVKNYLAGGVNLLDNKDTLDTRKILTYNSTNKIITNITAYDGNKKPFTQFLWDNNKQPSGYDVDTPSLKLFYEDRFLNYKNQLVTEGNLKYLNYSGGVGANQTVSILNTPYFVNSIQKGVENFRNNEIYPYVEAGYLFINSLPLATLRERYRTSSDSEDLSYIFATLKKFGGIHKLPYAWVLKYGSIWHRYKKYIETNVDILDSVWRPFDYVKNFDPVTEDINKMYSFDISGNTGVVDLVLQKRVTIGNEISDTINTGFYPKTINDFNVFLQGFEIFSGYTSTDFEIAIQSGFTLNYVNDAIISEGEGFDPNSPNRDLRIFSWTVHINSFDGVSSFIIPSQGSIINQTYNECFENDKLKIEVFGNQSVYDGSVRTFWTAPNYGYFNSSKVVKPLPMDYLKEIFSGQTQQENFSLNGDQTKYSKISEIFSVFEKEVLDLFETEFLDFCKSKYDFSYKNVTNNDSETSKIFKNFQLLMTELLKVEKITGNNGELIVEDAQKKQFKKVTDTIKNFVTNETLIVKFGNPSQFEKRLFYSFSNYDIVDPYTWNQYRLSTPNALPTIGGITLAASKAQYPLQWVTLETYVGFSEIPELAYDNDGSYITDFFIDMDVAFTENNIRNFAPIIKLYATQKLNDNTLNRSKFIGLMDDYIQSTLNLTNRVINNFFEKIQKQLPNVGNTVNTKVNSVLSGDQTKVEIWESFKALNDKWISGNNFKTKTLFEDVLLLDRASRNIGEKVIVDIDGLKDRLTNINTKTGMLTFIQTILIENNFVVMNLPSYVNFYNVQDAIKNPVPRSDGTLEFANTLFGNFLNVDYRESSSKLVCFFAGKPSEQLDLKNNVDYRYRNDAFELVRSSDNPMVEDLSNKTDWDKSNKVVGFNVDIGPQNQSIFYGFQVSQDAGKATIESLEVLNQMANQSGNRGGSTQSTSLYNLYKNRSYGCTVSMMGNAMIQPTMYFNLRYVPMFNGPYLITSVNHTITPGNFETIVEGIRQPVASLPKLDNYLQNLRKSLKASVEKITQSLKKERQEARKNTSTDGNIIDQKEGVNNDLINKPSTIVNSSISELCSGNLLDKYVNYIPITGTSKRNLTYRQMKSVINNVTSDDKLRKIIFCTVYLQTRDGVGFTSIESNFGGISISKRNQSENWGNSDTYFKKDASGRGSYYCSANNIAYVVFNDEIKSIEFLKARFEKRIGNVSLTKESITKFLILNNNTSKIRNENVYTTYDNTQKQSIESLVDEALKIYDSTL